MSELRDDQRHDPSDTPPPVVLVHGWGGSFSTTWERTGFTALLADAGRDVIGVDLLGHGDAPKPHDPDAYADLTERIVDALPQQPVDAIGFSLGALTLLRCAIAHPHRFHRLVLAGIGRNVFERDDAGAQKILAALDRVIDRDSAGPDNSAIDEEPVDNTSRLFARYAQQPGNDIVALAAVLRRPPARPITGDELSAVTCDTVVVVGDRDFVHPADELVAALPRARSVVLRNVDHFATPEAFGFIDAALEHLDAVPA